jgi:hypothetical protein
MPKGRAASSFHSNACSPGSAISALAATTPCASSRKSHSPRRLRSRRHAFELLKTDPQATRVIAKALKLPTNTTRRVLEDIAAQGLAVRSREIKQSSGDDTLFDKPPGSGEEKEEKKGGADLWTIAPSWADWCGKRQEQANESS